MEPNRPLAFVAIVIVMVSAVAATGLASPTPSATPLFNGELIYTIHRTYDFDGVNKSYAEFQQYDVQGRSGLIYVYVKELLQSYVVTINASTLVVESARYLAPANGTLDVGQNETENLFLRLPLPAVGSHLLLQGKDLVVLRYGTLSLSSGDFGAVFLSSDETYSFRGSQIRTLSTLAYDTETGVELLQEVLSWTSSPNEVYFSNDTMSFYSF